MPYLDESILFRSIDLQAGWNAESNASALSASPRLFRCRADYRVGLDHAGITVYVGMAGIGPVAETLPLGDARAGYFGHVRKVTDRDVRDGTSHTILFIETTRQNGPWSAGGTATVRGVDPEDEQPVRKGGAFGLVHSGTNRNWGRLGPVAMVALGDASTRSIQGDIASEILCALATIAGHEDVATSY